MVVENLVTHSLLGPIATALLRNLHMLIAQGVCAHVLASTVYKYQVHKVHSYISMITRKNSAGNFVPTKISSSVIDTFYNHPKNATGIQATE